MRYYHHFPSVVFKISTFRSLKYQHFGGFLFHFEIKYDCYGQLLSDWLKFKISSSRSETTNVMEMLHYVIFLAWLYSKFVFNLSIENLRLLPSTWQKFLYGIIYENEIFFSLKLELHWTLYMNKSFFGT